MWRKPTRNRGSMSCTFHSVIVFLFTCENYFRHLSTNIYTHIRTWRERRKEISTSYYILLRHNLMVTWDVLIDTWYFTLPTPRGIAIHSDEYRLPSLITWYVFGLIDFRQYFRCAFQKIRERRCSFHYQ